MSDNLIHEYLKKLESAYQSGKATEHTYRPALKDLFENTLPGISAINEPKRIQCGAPDYVISRKTGHGPLTIGYAEAKDINVLLDLPENQEQLKRYLTLGNVLHTDYLEFRWYVNGQCRLTGRLGNVINGRISPADKGSIEAVEQILQEFLGFNPEPISKPQELAERMARLAHMIREITVNTFENRTASDILLGLYRAFQEVLIPELSESEFADMFAQTLAYGLFAARYNHKGREPFTRSHAAAEIPRTNPFLRRLFSTITGPDLDDEPFAGFVDDLAQMLADTDIDAVLADFGRKTRRHDPIVHFYETFLATYDQKLREIRGVYYTPEPVVSYIVRSVDQILKTHFGCPQGLADSTRITYERTGEKGQQITETSPKVLILDPACGTGTFHYEVINTIREWFMQSGNAGMWSGYVREHLLPRLFGFELLMAPYAMAHLKLGMQLAGMDLSESQRNQWAYDFESDERLGIYLTNTLDEASKKSEMLMGQYISDEANEASRVKREYPVMVVLGNPPYSGNSANKGKWITDLLHGKDNLTGKNTGNYFQVDGHGLNEKNPKFLNDDYVKFIRFAQWRIEQTGHGVLAFITNHGYLDNPTFRGMRQSLMETFDEIYILDLHGNSRKKETSPDGSKDENVFDIQQGVAIGIFVKNFDSLKNKQIADVYYSDLWGTRDDKYNLLATSEIKSTEWHRLSPQSPFYLFQVQNSNLQDEYKSYQDLTKAMPLSVNGFKSHRDNFAIDFEKSGIKHRMLDFINTDKSDEELEEKYKLSQTETWKITNVRRRLRSEPNWENHIIGCLYRPFDKRACYFSSIIMDRPRRELIENVESKNNLTLLLIRQMADSIPYSHFLATNIPSVDRCFACSRGASVVFPLYLYQANNSLWDNDISTDSKKMNFSNDFQIYLTTKLSLNMIGSGSGDLQTTFGPEDIFNYMYAVFNSPTYRSRYAEFLKIDFPRLPVTSSLDLFRDLCRLGERLVGLHLMKASIKTFTGYPIKGNDRVEAVRYTDPIESQPGRVWINKTQYFENIPPEVWEFHIGGYQVCEKWLKDRKGRKLEYSDLEHYQKIIATLAETIQLMQQVDETIEEHGGWPIQ